MDASSLLPFALEELRGAVPIVDSLPAKGRPRRSPKVTDELRTVRDIYRRTGVLAHIGLGPDEAYALIDKQQPHAVFEVMVLSAGRRRRAGLHNHSSRFGTAMGALAGCWRELSSSGGS